MRKYAARVDGNHAEIREGLRKAGCSVVDMSRAGDGFPDLAVGRAGINVFLEIKNGSKKAGELTKEQKRFADSWRGQYAIVTSLDEAMDAVKRATLG